MQRGGRPRLSLEVTRCQIVSVGDYRPGGRAHARHGGRAAAKQAGPLTAAARGARQRAALSGAITAAGAL